MNDVDPAPQPATPAPGVGPRAVLARVGIGLVVVVAIIATGLEIYHNQRDKAGMPVVMASAPPVHETAAPTVEDVVTRLEKAVQATPGDADAWRNLGWAHFQLGDFKAAVRELERAVELRPQDPTINDHLGDAYWKVGRRNEARFQWQRALLSAELEDTQRAAIRTKLERGLAQQ